MKLTASASSSRMLAAAVTAGLAGWCSLGTLGTISAGSVASRVAFLPPWWLLPALIVIAFGVILVIRPTASQIDPLFGSSVLILPWLPGPLPAAALLWTGPFAAAVWAAVVVGVMASCGAGEQGSRRPVIARLFINSGRAPLLAGTVALSVFAASAWWLSPVLPDGDSPHYLIITQSLIKDGDLRIENNHQAGDDLEYSLFAAEPHFQRRGVDGAIYSIHSPGVPVLIAPAFLVGGYWGAVGFLAMVAAIGTALVWYLSWRMTGSVAAAWFGWACCALTIPFVFQATQVFPDGLAATLLLVGMLPILRRHFKADDSDAVFLLAGTSLAILPWLQTRLAIASAMVALCMAFHLRARRQLAFFLAVPLVSAAGWFAYFYTLYGTPSPSAPYGAYGENTQTALGNLVRGFPGLLFDEQFGVIPNAPVFGFVLVGALVTARRQRLVREILVVAVPYLIAVGMFQIWYGGASTPARLVAPLALLFGLVAAVLWKSFTSSATKNIGLLTLTASLVIAAAQAIPDRGRLLINARDGISMWLEWANDLLDLPRGVPSLFREDPATAWLIAAAWALSVAAGWFALRQVQARRDNAFVNGSWPATWSVAISVMAALTVSWWIAGAQPVTPITAELGLFRKAAWFRPLAYDYGQHRFEPSRVALARARIRTDEQRRSQPPAPLLVASTVPAGTYRVHVESAGQAAGTFALRVGTTPLVMSTTPLTQPHESNEDPLTFPVDVASISIDGDEIARRALSVALVPLKPNDFFDRAMVPPRGTARRAVAYGAVRAYFMDDLAYAEPTGFWVAGGRTARIFFESFGNGRDLFLRNVPVANTVTIDIDEERLQIPLGPGEEKLVPLMRTGRKRDPVVYIHTEKGIRPSLLDPASGDRRFLGCWLEIR
jgi:hypothetical protein